MSLTGNSPTSVASFAYNPTPIGLGLGLAGAVLGGKSGRKNEKLIPSYENGKYYVAGDMQTPKHEVNVDPYLVQGKDGVYNVMSYARSPSVAQKMQAQFQGRSLSNGYNEAFNSLSSDPVAQANFQKTFGSFQDNNPTAAQKAQIQFGSRVAAPHLQFGQVAMQSARDKAIQRVNPGAMYNNVNSANYKNRDFRLVQPLANGNNVPFFTPAKLASALVSNGASPQYQAPNIAYQAPK